MLHHLHNLRQKPEIHRKQIALSVSAVVTGLIAIIWVSTFSFSLGEMPKGQTASVVQPSPVTSIKDSAVGGYQDVLKLLENNPFNGNSSTSTTAANVQTQAQNEVTISDTPAAPRDDLPN